ncbi:hypothetical protein QVD17_13732 [Tagetes erecta]|uniref:Ubiquitin-like protease family profile domain-containing protein n=1 Tax=Tagetes erecta TaxID=13708 RepID=A0AAD8NWB5_TARER|nr:hypothetical protein QVD17_13732 [Tagetes erecta]
MGALTSNRNKRDAASIESSGSGYDLLHIAKKHKSSHYTGLMKPSRNFISRLRLYPRNLTPISREVHAPCRYVSGFTSKLKRIINISSEFIAKKSVFANDLSSEYDRAKEYVIDGCKDVEEEDDVVEVIDIDEEEIVDDEKDDDLGSSSVDVIEILEDEREHIMETKQIVAKYMELDRKGSSELINGKMLRSLSLNQGRSDVMDVNVGVPLHKKLHCESDEKHGSSLRRLRFDIKLLEAKLAIQQKLHPAKKKEDVANDPFRPLTEEEKQMVDNALSYSNRNKVLVTHENSNITITGEVLQCLRPNAWLNDEVINLYFELLKERETREPKKFLKCHFFNTFFYKKLISGKNGYDYKSVRRWTTQKKLGYTLLECDKIFVPIHKKVHWCLAVINKKEEKFQYLDSLGGADKIVLRMLAKYIMDEVKDKTGKNIDVTSWTQEFITDCPIQANGHDCGMFMIKYADFYSRDIGLCFNQDHMPYFRLRTAKEILKLRAN